MKNNSDLFYTCSLIEYLGRQQKLRRSDVVRALGEETIRRIYNYADVFHCEPIAKTSDDFITLRNIPTGDFDNITTCKYKVPDYWTIGEVYSRLIEDVCGGNVVSTLIEVYTSWFDRELSNFNSDLFYQPRDYLAECYRTNEIIDY